MAVEAQPRLKPVLDDCDAGVGLALGDAEALVGALEWHAAHPLDAARRGRNARAYAEQHLLRDEVVGTFERELRGRLGLLANGRHHAVP